MKCSYCNNEVPSGARKCPSCGATVEAQATPPPKSAPAQEAVSSPKAQGSDINSTMQTMMQQQMMQQQMMMNQQMQKQMEDMKKSPKSRATYMVLCILLAGTGISNFYIGRVGVGIIQLILTCTMAGWVISAPWNFIEAFIVKKDSFGRELS